MRSTYVHARAIRYYMWKKIRKFIFRCILFFFISTISLVVLFRWVPVKYTPLMLQRYIENFSNDDFRTRKQWRPISEISYNMVLAVMASEDNNFMEHSGFDWDAIDRAMEHNRRSNKKHGASTITQQTAKNVFLLPSRTWVRKGLEAYFTLLVEVFWSKERIMEVYLNVIETGKGIYGVEAAAQTYFRKSAAKLTRGEAALIAAILPNPQQRNPAKPSQYLLQRQAKIMKLMTLLNPPDIAARKN